MTLLPGTLRIAATAVLVLGLAACSSSAADTSASSSAPASSGSTIKTVRLGFFPNVTHGPALVGLQEGLFKNALKPLGLTVTPTAFNAGPDAVSALFGDSLDITYIGPNPTINAYAESQGQAVKVIAGAASGGAALVVRPGIDSAEDLKGRKFATPQLGNTQDVAFRAWLKAQGLSADTEGGGDVSIAPQANAEGLAAYSAGQIDGAWVPEPFVSQYVKAGAKVLVDEASLWPDGKFVTTNVVARTKFLQEHPDAVAAFLAGHLAALKEIDEHPKASAEAANATLKSLTGSELEGDVLASAWKAVDFTADPLPATLKKSADDAISVGLLDADKVEAAGGLPGTLYDLTLLNKALSEAGEQEVATS